MQEYEKGVCSTRRSCVRDGMNFPRYIYWDPYRRGWVAKFGMTVLPCQLMIRGGVLSPGLEIHVDR